MPNKKIVGYLRVSSKKQENSGLSLEAQEEKIRAFANMEGAKVVKIFKDTISGGAKDRPELNRLLRDAVEGNFEEVVVFSLDRLGRNCRDNLDLIAKFKALGVNLISLRERLDFSTPVGRVVFSVLSSLAEMELEIMRERIVVAKEQKLERGQFNIFAPRFPLKWAEDGKSLVVDEVKFRTWKLIKKWKLDEGLNFKEIAERLNALPLDKRIRKKWSKVTVSEVINNQDLVKGFVNLSLNGLSGEEIKKEVPCPKLLTEGEWEKLQQLIKRNRTYIIKGKKGHLLSKMLRCQRCGRILQIHQNRVKQKIYYYFRCVRKGCDLPYLPEKFANEKIMITLASTTENWDMVEQAIRQATSRGDEIDLNELAERERDLDRQELEIRRNQERLLDQVEAGTLAGELIKKRSDEIVAGLKIIAQQRDEIKTQRALAGEQSARKEELKKAWQRILKGWAKATPREQRRILETLFPDSGSIAVDFIPGNEGTDAYRRYGQWSFELKGIIPNPLSGQTTGYHTYYGIGL